MELYITNTGAKLSVHSKEDCKGEHCVIHNPSNHHMLSWDLIWRDDRRIFERICPHGIGHPDPDCLNAKADGGVHGCDGCCNPPNKKK